MIMTDGSLIACDQVPVQDEFILGYVSRSSIREYGTAVDGDPKCPRIDIPNRYLRSSEWNRRGLEVSL
jgi:hypothetical protein